MAPACKRRVVLELRRPAGREPQAGPGGHEEPQPSASLLPTVRTCDLQRGGCRAARSRGLFRVLAQKSLGQRRAAQGAGPALPRTKDPHRARQNRCGTGEAHSDPRAAREVDQSAVHAGLGRPRRSAEPVPRDRAGSLEPPGAGPHKGPPGAPRRPPATGGVGRARFPASRPPALEFLPRLTP